VFEVRATQRPLFFRDAIKGADRGFSLIELALGMALIGIVLGGALLVGSKLWQHDRRQETAAYMERAKASLLTYASVNGCLPGMDFGAGNPGDGNGDAFVLVVPIPATLPSPVAGWYPYRDTGLEPLDSYGAVLQYCVNWRLSQFKVGAGGTEQCDRASSCDTLQKFFADRTWTVIMPTTNYRPANYVNPARWDGVGVNPWGNDNGSRPHWFPFVLEPGFVNPTPAAAVLVSSGEKNFEVVNTALPVKMIERFDVANANATNENGYDYKSMKYFARKPSDPAVGFDDMVLTVTPVELYEALGCDAQVEKY